MKERRKFKAPAPLELPMPATEAELKEQKAHWARRGVQVVFIGEEPVDTDSEEEIETGAAESEPGESVSEESEAEEAAPEEAAEETEEAPAEEEQGEPASETPAIPEGRVCPHCGAKARTDDSYLRNHGDNCLSK